MFWYKHHQMILSFWWYKSYQNDGISEQDRERLSSQKHRAGQVAHYAHANMRLLHSGHETSGRQTSATRAPAELTRVKQRQGHRGCFDCILSIEDDNSVSTPHLIPYLCMDMLIPTTQY